MATEPITDPSSSGHRLVAITRLAGRYLVLVVVAMVVLFPVYAAAMVAQKPLSKLGDLGVLVPGSLNLGNVPAALGDAGMGRYLLNSIIVSGAITGAQVATSVLAGYALAFIEFRGRRVVLVAIAATLMVPFEVTVVVNFETVQRFGGIDTYWALILPFLAFPLGTFLLRQAFLGIPRDLRDAAAVEGYGHLRFLWRVALPLARPTMAALSLYSFLLAWNQYLWPLLVTNDESRRTVQVGIAQLGDATGADLHVLMAATLIATVPIVVLLIVFERQLIRGLTTGAVKG